jgi:propionyl-CoA carboxylase alpha chain
VVDGDERHPARIAPEGGDAYRATLEGSEHRVALAWNPGTPVATADVDGARLTLQIDRDGIGWRLMHGGATIRVTVLPPRIATLLEHMPARQAPDLSRYLLSPMPGLLLSLAVAEGQEVKAGEPLATVEAMKMENLLRADRNCTVAKVHAAVGDSLTVDQKILEFE